MGTLEYASIVSIDGYFEGPDGGFGWAVPDQELHARINAAQARYDTCVLGRAMYEVMRAWDGVDPATLPPVEAGFARLWAQKRRFVASTTLTTVDPPAQLIRGDLVEAVRALKQAEDAAISVGGAGVARPLIEAGLVDAFTLWVVPVMVGGGKPFWPTGLPAASLRLAGSRAFAGGAVELRYVRD